ncbi:PH domain-containing protein [Thalassotalea ponticola]|uniref:PH domain-containing protein n=1 Tax=Thalassotalea ponticola TaxID=1523392 RepID=UPI0025B3DFEF|nr:PH domain-containing protein [Thalassotalea ponticola]MDN3652507.1 PH domain-containing protein [Thalassotalea ponticola]
MVSTTNQWQRIAPIAIIYFALQLARSVMGNFVYMLPALLLLANQVQNNPHIWWPIIIAAAAALTLSAILSFYFFQYRLSDQKIEIRSGVLARKYVDLPFAKIQNIELGVPFYYRPFGYCCIQFDTAGTAAQEAKIVAIDTVFANQLKQEILATQSSHTDQVDTIDSTQQDQQHQSSGADKQVIDRRNLDDLVIHGLTNNRVWILLAGLAPFIDNAFDKVGYWLQYWGFNVSSYFDLDSQSLWQVIGSVLTAALAVIFVISLISILGAIIIFHRFVLIRQRDKYIRECGLFTRTEVTMRLSRLQKIVCQQSWLDKLLGRTNLRFEQVNANTPNLNGHDNQIIVPSVTRKERDFLLGDAFPDAAPTAINYQPVSQRLFWRNIMLFVLPITTIASYKAILANDQSMLIAIAVLASLASALFYLRYRRWGWARDHKYTYVRYGCLGVNYQVFETFKVQQTTFKQSWLLKRHQLCTVQFVLAAGSVQVPYIAEQQGFDWLNSTLTEVEISRRNWM